MSQNNNGNRCMGILLLVIPFIALIFGSDEPAMQTDNAALLMTGMIFFGIILIASSGKKSSNVTPSVTSSSYTSLYSEGSTVSHGASGPHTSPKRYCPHCGASIEVAGARFCESCGETLSNT